MAGDLVAMAAALSQGTEVNRSIGEEEGRTPLIGAAVGVRRRYKLKYNHAVIIMTLVVNNFINPSHTHIMVLKSGNPF